MAVKYASSSSGALHLILRFSDLRNTVRDERLKRLSHEASNSRPTYHTGQEAYYKMHKNTN